LRLIEMNTVDFQNAMNEMEDPKTIIIPSGAYEVWGPHLPIGADTIVAEEMASRLAEKMGWIVGPTLPVGDSIMVWGPGTVTVQAESFKAYLEDICESLIAHGFERFCFMNPHVGNVPIISQVAWKMKMEQEVDSCVFDWWRFIQPICTKEDILDNEGMMAHGHASEAGTSVFLYLRPDLVKMDRAICTEPEIQNDYPDVIQYLPFADVSKTCLLGDATTATREKGEKIVESALKRMVDFLNQW